MSDTGYGAEAQALVDELHRAIRAANARAAELGIGGYWRWPDFVQNEPEWEVEPPTPSQPTHTTGSVCPTCQSPNVQRMGGCEVCVDCGESVGGCG